jgi:hypothetical protein
MQRRCPHTTRLRTYQCQFCGHRLCDKCRCIDTSGRVTCLLDSGFVRELERERMQKLKLALCREKKEKKKKKRNNAFKVLLLVVCVFFIFFLFLKLRFGA